MVMTTSRRWYRSLTGQALAAVVAGLAVGALALRANPVGAAAPLPLADAIISAWTSSFRLVVVPLIVTQLFLAVVTQQGVEGELRRLGLIVPTVFGGLLVLGALVTFGIVTSLMVSTPLAGLALGSTPPADATAAPASTSSWQSAVATLLPPGMLAVTDYLLPIMLLTCVFALAARQSSELGTLSALATGGRDASLRIVRWLLAPTPLILFVLSWRAAVTSGLEVGGVLLGFVVVECVALVALTLALYPVATVLGGVSLSRFARAALPAQLTAATTRSSLATVPSLLEAGVATLGMRAAIAAYVIPFAGATLKLSRVVSNPTKLVFLIHVLGLEVTTHQIVVFTLTVLLLSPTTVGVPSVISGSRSLPAYVAAGIPAEFVLLLATTTWLADVFMTVLNTTGYLTAGVITHRFAVARHREPREKPALTIVDVARRPEPVVGPASYVVETDERA